MTTEFRPIYATIIKRWAGYRRTRTILKEGLTTRGVFG
jgi:hypothetical protein